MQNLSINMNLWPQEGIVHLKSLLNSTLGRDASHSCLINLWPKDECTTTTRVVVIYSSLGQRLKRHKWEASLSDVGLSKTLNIKGSMPFSKRTISFWGQRFVHPTDYIVIFILLSKVVVLDYNQFCSWTLSISKLQLFMLMFYIILLYM